MLLNEQIIFLERYANEKGDTYGVLESMGLEPNHLLLWRDNPEFDTAYRNIQLKVINFLNSENYITGIRRINEILERGYDEETVTQRERVIRSKDKSKDSDNSEGKAIIREFEVTRKTVKKGIPAQILQLAIRENTLTQALNTLMNQGIIPESTARKILSRSDSIAEELSKAFDNSQKDDNITEDKAIALMKQAILKGVESD